MMVEQVRLEARVAAGWGGARETGRTELGIAGSPRPSVLCERGGHIMQHVWHP